MKQFFVIASLLFLTILIHGQNDGIEGIYERHDCRQYIKLHNGRFEFGQKCREWSSPYWLEPDTIVPAIGSYKRINDYLLELNTENPAERMKRLLYDIRKHSDTSIPKDSVDIIVKLYGNDYEKYIIHLYASAASCDTTLFVQGLSTAVARIPRIDGGLNCSIALANPFNYYGYTGEFEYFPVSTVNEGQNICTVTSDDNAIELVFMIDRYFAQHCVNVRLKDDYLMIKGDTLIWHGEEFYQQDNVINSNVTVDNHVNNLFDGYYYNDDINGWIELKNDSFECYLPNENDTYTKHLGAFSFGKFHGINDSLLVFDSKEPSRWLFDNTIKDYYMIDTIPNGITEIRIIAPSEDSLHVYLSGGFSPESDDKEKWFTINKDTIVVSIDDILDDVFIGMTWASQNNFFELKHKYEFFPVVGMLYSTMFENKDWFTPKNVFYMDFSDFKSLSSALMYMYLKGEYIRMDEDELLWHGLVFRKTEKP